MQVFKLNFHKKLVKLNVVSGKDPKPEIILHVINIV